jgi:CDP-diacylglycerol--glycerol-3-phosphate 3-phosphatidyltransferase
VWCRRAPDGLLWYVAFTIYLVGMLGDWLDGYLARSRGQVTAFGRIADPFADKIVVLGVLILGLTLPQTQEFVPSWIVLIVLAREFLVSGLRSYLESRGRGFGASWEGKTKLIVQAVYCGAIVFYPGHRMAWVWWIANITLWGTLVLSVYSAANYIRVARDVLSKGADI